MSSLVNEDNIQQKLESITGAQDSIQSVSLWIIHHKSESQYIVNIWLKVLKKVVVSQKLLLFYLCNDVVQNCKRKQASEFLESFKSVLGEGLQVVRDPSIKPKVLRILTIWQDRNVYKPKFITKLKLILEGDDSPVTTTPVKNESTYTATKKQPKSNGTKESKAKDNATSASSSKTDLQLLAEYKPQSFIHKVTAFRKMELENEIKQQQLSKIKFEESSLEEIKQLKDKVQGKEFTRNFEDAVSKLEATVKYLEQDVSDRGEVVGLAETSELFYDEQYKEAKIVANAYRNFGTRINNMKRKLEDIKNKFPSSPSPIPSPIVDAPSPEPTPPQADPNDYTNPLDMEMDSDEERKKRRAANDPRANQSRKNKPKSVIIENPPVAPQTPEIQFNKIEEEPQKTKSVKDKSQKKSHSRMRSVVSIVTPDEKETSRKMQHKEVEESNDEGCSTPVQDEASIEPVFKKENPIDFLTKLLSKSSSVPGTGASFLQNLSLLTSTVKSEFEQSKQVTDSENKEVQHENQEPEGNPSWSAWNKDTTQHPSFAGHNSEYSPEVSMNSNVPQLTLPTSVTSNTSSGMPIRLVTSVQQQISGLDNDAPKMIPVSSPLQTALSSHNLITGNTHINQFSPGIQSEHHGPVLPPHMLHSGQSQMSPPSPEIMYPQIQSASPDINMLSHSQSSPDVLMPPQIQLNSDIRLHPQMQQPSPEIMMHHQMPQSNSEVMMHSQVHQTSPEVMRPLLNTNVLVHSQIQQPSPELMMHHQMPPPNAELMMHPPSPKVLLMQQAPNVHSSIQHISAIPRLVHQTGLAPPPPPPPPQTQSHDMADGGLDDILNQIVTGKGFQHISDSENDNLPERTIPVHSSIGMADQRSDDFHLPFKTSSSFLDTPQEKMPYFNSVLHNAVPFSTNEEIRPVFMPPTEATNVNSYGDPHQSHYTQGFESVERDPAEDIEDFSEKLNSGVSNSNVHGNSFSRNRIRPNLMCLTPQEDEINAIESIQSISTVGTRDQGNIEINPAQNFFRRTSVIRELEHEPGQHLEHESVSSNSRLELPLEEQTFPLDNNVIPPPRHHHPPHHQPHHPSHHHHHHRPPPRSYSPPDHYNHRPPGGGGYPRHPPPERFRHQREPYYGPPPPKRPFPPDVRHRRPFYRY